ncbi:unnamed protein product [Chrysoparadoxa australica]
MSTSQAALTRPQVQVKAETAAAGLVQVPGVPTDATAAVMLQQSQAIAQAQAQAQAQLQTQPQAQAALPPNLARPPQVQLGQAQTQPLVPQTQPMQAQLAQPNLMPGQAQLPGVQVQPPVTSQVQSHVMQPQPMRAQLAQVPGQAPPAGVMMQAPAQAQAQAQAHPQGLVRPPQTQPGQVQVPLSSQAQGLAASDSGHALQQAQSVPSQAQNHARPPLRLVGGWQSNDDIPHRKKILTKILAYLQQRKPNVRPEWIKKVPQMAKRLEDSLYRSAASFEDYSDMSTLRQRLQQLAVRLGTKAQHAKLQQGGGGALPGVPSGIPQGVPSGMPQGQKQVGSIPSQPQQVVANGQVMQGGAAMPQQATAPAGGNRTFVQMADINSMVVGAGSAAAGSASSGSGSGMQPQQQQQHQQPVVQQGQQAQRRAATYTAEQRKQALRQQQQRLLLLRHASKCPAEEGRECHVTPHCASMKKLWKHIAECKNHSCQMAHCVSSRFVLSHYHRCKDAKCAVCAPVREVIWKSHERQQAQGRQAGLPMGNVTKEMLAQMNPQQIAELKARQKQALANLTPAQIAQLPEGQRQQAMSLKAQLARQGSQSKVQQVYAAGQQAGASAEVTRGGKPKRVPKGIGSRGKRSNASANGQGPQAGAGAGQVRGAPAQLQGQPPVKKSRGSVPGPEMGGPPYKAAAASQRGATLPPNIASGGSARSRLVVSGRASTVKAELQIGDKMKTPEEATSLVEAFSVDQIENHLRSLHDGLHLTAARLKQYTMPLLKKLMEHQFGWVFNNPVDPAALGLLDYFQVIKNPMDLGTVKKNLEASRYRTMEAFAKDVCMVFTNAMTYNPPGSEVYPVAQALKNTFEQEWSELQLQIKSDEESRKCNGEACSLCGYEQLSYEPMTYYCNGQNCNMQRIRRNAFFYIGASNRYHWCPQCYNDLPETEAINMGDVLLNKSDLVRKKNDELHEEPWVECDHCKRWVHQICALFNGRCNTNEHVAYFCPDCILASRKKAGKTGPTALKLGPKDMATTQFSSFLEAAVMKKLKETYEKEAAALGKPVEDIGKANTLYIRQVSSQDVNHLVKPNFLKRYKGRGIADELPARSKCVLLFQEMDGVDVLLFGMYVYEYGHKCPQPNQRRVYISYLDSVYYFRPRRFRTLVYKEILIAYLDYVKRRGFHTAHIWACPPAKGDDYILYCHPEDQKTPKDDRLQQWYVTMLETARKRGIVENVSNLYDECWGDPSKDASTLPYLEGDYWVGEAEQIIKELEDNGMSEIGGENGASLKSKKNNKRAVRQDLSRSNADPLMRKLGDIIEPMKQSFIVAYLRSKDFIKECHDRRVLEIKVEAAKQKVKELEASSITPDPELLRVAAQAVPKDETVESEQPMDSEILDTRQTFLNLCQGNHYQFDQLRRAKHSSIMVLYHLCNPDAPKFLSNCAACYTEINSGNRYHCEACQEFDLCLECYQKVGRDHPHPLKPIPVRTASSQPQLTERQRAERQRSIQLHMQLLQHASSCTQDCPSQNCKRMKGLLAHGTTCTQRAGGGCPICRRIWALLQIHARQCRAENCAVPKCKELREHLRQLALQQQQMDNRRRQAMNDWYRDRQNAKTETS